jgi:uncharacterized metal-binding protein
MTRTGVVVCGANGERGMLMEEVIERFAQNNRERIIQFSVCSVALSPMIMEMSGLDMHSLVAVNGCRNRCVDRILKIHGVEAASSCVLDDAVGRKLAPCMSTSTFGPLDDEGVDEFVKLIEEALDG